MAFDSSFSCKIIDSIYNKLNKGIYFSVNVVLCKKFILIEHKNYGNNGALSILQETFVVLGVKFLFFLKVP